MTPAMEQAAKDVAIAREKFNETVSELAKARDRLYIAERSFQALWKEQVNK